MRTACSQVSKSDSSYRRYEPNKPLEHVRHARINTYYRIWTGMMSRCYSENSVSYKYYGARGIQVCARWHNFDLFVDDILDEIGPRPEGKTLDRTDNDSNYEPGKVRWSTPTEQQANRTTVSLGEDHHKSVLTEEKVRAIRFRYKNEGNYNAWTGRPSYQDLANEYGVSRDTIIKIVKRKIWKHI